MDNLRGLLGIRRMDRVPNALIRQLCGVAKGVNERIYETVLRWSGHIERMENDRIAMWENVWIFTQVDHGRGGLIQ